MPGSLADWLANKPIPAMLALTAAVIHFGFLVRQGSVHRPTAIGWLRHLLSAGLRAILLIGLLVGFKAVLDKAAFVYRQTHEDLTSSDWELAKSTWGDQLTQYEPAVHQYVEVESTEPIPQVGGLPLLYHTVRTRQLLPQDGLAAFNGAVILSRHASQERPHVAKGYNTYYVNASYDYTIVNTTTQITSAEIDFPIAQGPVAFDTFEVMVDGHNLDSQLRFQDGVVSWQQPMQPGQQSHITIQYSTFCTDAFVYKVTTPRDIRNFTLKIDIYFGDIYVITLPASDSFNAQFGGGGPIQSLTWHIDHELMSPSMGVAFVQSRFPYAAYLSAIQLITLAPDGLMLFGTGAVLTWLLLGQPLELANSAMLLAAYCAHYIAFAGLSDYVGTVGAMLIGALLAVGLLALAQSHARQTNRYLVTSLAVCCLAYPLLALIPDEDLRLTFVGLAQIILILYLFALALIFQLRPGNQE